MSVFCWWFGCKPGKLSRHYYSDGSGCDDYYNCVRCGNEVDYGDLVGDTRHARFVAALKYWLFRRWFPEKCCDCGKRYGDHKGCLPF